MRKQNEKKVAREIAKASRDKNWPPTLQGRMQQRERITKAEEKKAEIARIQKVVLSCRLATYPALKGQKNGDRDGCRSEIVAAYRFTFSPTRKYRTANFEALRKSLE